MVSITSPLERQSIIFRSEQDFRFFGPRLSPFSV